MKYRIIGKTGLQVSVLGFGCMRLPVIGKDPSRIDEEKAMGMIHHAIDRGINYFDTAYPYHAESFKSGGASEPFLAKALRNGYRDRVYVATKLPSWLIESRKDMDRFLEEQLKRLETGTIDFYLLHALNRTTWDKLLRNDVLGFLEGAIRAGKIRYAGFSFHDKLDLFKEIVDAYDWSLAQIMYNYFDENFQAGREGLEYAVQKEIAVVAMEPLRGGSLVHGLPPEAREVLREAAPERSEVEWALRWLWDQPGVSMVLSGMSRMDHVEENLKLAIASPSNPWTDRDSEAVGRVTRIIQKRQRVNCTDCGYCMPCPYGINIPRNFSLCNDHHMLQDPGARVRYYRLLSEEERASSCIQCGECVEKCPQKIDIPAELEHVSGLFNSGP